MRLLVPAKINLHLRVGKPRPDGFHPILSWMCTVGLFDELELSAGQSGIELTCDDPSIPTGADNLIVKAALALGGAGRSAKVNLTKRIPAGGGLAGGSSDAAATLSGLNNLWQMNRTSTELAQIAARLGSDISFFFHAPSANCTGLGEIVRRTSPPAARWALLILPPYGMATPAVYRRFDEINAAVAGAIDTQPDFAAWANSSAEQLLDHLVNDLEKPAFDLNPELNHLRRHWEQRLRRPVRMSGSGSTLFTLFDTKSLADAAAQNSLFSGESLRVVELAPAVAKL